MTPEKVLDAIKKAEGRDTARSTIIDRVPVSTPTSAS
jgi:hypothetical protein